MMITAKSFSIDPVTPEVTSNTQFTIVQNTLMKTQIETTFIHYKNNIDSCLFIY